MAQASALFYLSQARLHFIYEPLVIVDQALDGLNHEGIAIAALFGGEAGQFGLQFHRKRHFHNLRLGTGSAGVNTCFDWLAVSTTLLLWRNTHVTTKYLLSFLDSQSG